MRVLTTPVILPDADSPDPRLRFYQAEPSDLWLGFIVAPAGWNGRGLLPCAPAATPYEAMQNWLQQRRRRRKHGGLRSRSPSANSKPNTDR